jgi:putative acyl-CoA dehydrogenase
MSSQPADRAPYAVLNQARLATGWNAFSDDRLLAAIAKRYAPWVAERAAKLGAYAGDPNTQELARLANRHTPELRTHDRYGNRADWVELHPAWHELMAIAFGHEVHSIAWTDARPGAHVARGILSYVWNEIENGVACPAGMTYAAYPGLMQPEFKPWQDKILSAHYDKRPLPLQWKTGATIGYAMTEKQGGSDLRQTQTTARYLEPSAEGSIYLLNGHKWFFSMPQSDGVFILARTQAGVTCFFVPGFLPDGTRNALRLQRLKDKCGNRSNASSEVEFHDTLAWLVGEEGHGIREILSHEHLTRLDFAIGSAGLMRHALTLAINHAETRRGFGSTLADQPMMTNILSDLAIDVEAATLLAFRAARATDAMDHDPYDRRLARIATPLAKYWNCKRAPAVVAEALECHGGNGFIEENPIARLYREAPLNTIWEGTSNMMCMDVLRCLKRDPETADVFMAEVGKAKGAHRALDRCLDKLGDDIARLHNNDGHARRLCGDMANALQASALHEDGSSSAFDAFCAARLDPDGRGSVYGVLDDSSELSRIIADAAVVRH